MIYLVIGFLAGFFGSITGLGGGIIIVPVLTILFHIPIHKAIGVSLVAIVVNSSFASSAYMRKGFTDLKLALSLEQSTVIGAIAGAVFSGFIAPKILGFIFGVVLLFASIQMLTPMGRHLAEKDLKIWHLNPIYRIEHTTIGVLSSFFAGCVSGMLGVGGGIFKIPIMCLIMKVPVKVAVATSSMMILITGTSSAWIYYLRGDIYLELVILVSAGVLMGSLLGSQIGVRIKATWQTYLIAALLILASLRMLIGIK